MKRLLIILIILIPTLHSFAQKACPTNLDSKTIKDIEKNINEWHGRVVAFEAIVSDIKVGNVNKPFYKVILDDEYVWIGGHGESEYISVGRLQRILGIVFKVESDDDINKKYNSKGYFILSMGFIDMESKQGSVFPEAKFQFDEWMSGKIPTVKN